MENPPNPALFVGPVQEEICTNLNFEDAISLRAYLNLPELKCRIPIKDKENHSLIMPRIDDTTLATHQLLQQFGIKEALTKAIEKNQDAIVDVLFTIGKDYINVNTNDLNGFTPLVLAAGRDAIKVLQLLLEKGADINGIDQHTWTPLMRAVMGKQHNAMFFLVEKGANVNQQDKEGRTALHWAVPSLNTISISYLLEFGADPNLQIHYSKFTPLLLALYEQKVEVALELLESPNVDVNLTDVTGKSALYYAMINQQFNVIKKLLERGADPMLIIDGKPIKDRAYGKVAQILKDAGY